MDHLDSITEEALIKALDKCWKDSPQAPIWMPMGVWPYMQLQEFVARGHCRRTDELYKAVKRAEEQLARDWRR